MAKKTPVKKASANRGDPALAAYLDAFPPATRKVLDRIRAAIRRAAPDAEETRSYGVGAFKRGGTYIVYYAGYPKHVALYPVYADDPALGPELKPHVSGKATAKFPFDKPIPYELIAKIVKAKAAEHEGRLKARAAKVKGAAAQSAKAALAKKSVKKAAGKVAKKNKKAAKPLKAFDELPNLSWSLLKEVAPAKRKASQKRVKRKSP